MQSARSPRCRPTPRCAPSSSSSTAGRPVGAAWTSRCTPSPRWTAWGSSPCTASRTRSSTSACGCSARASSSTRRASRGYEIERGGDGRKLTARAQTRMCGNSVSERSRPRQVRRGQGPRPTEIAASDRSTPTSTSSATTTRARAWEGFRGSAGDYTYFHTGGHGVIEVKQVAHDFRLPQARTSTPTSSVCIRKRAARRRPSASCWSSTPPRSKWRLVPFSFFLERANQPSWDLTEFKQFESAKAVMYMAGFPTYDE
jgi:hypothetical protein